MDFSSIIYNICVFDENTTITQNIILFALFMYMWFINKNINVKFYFWLCMCLLALFFILLAIARIYYKIPTNISLLAQVIFFACSLFYVYTYYVEIKRKENIDFIQKSRKETINRIYKALNKFKKENECDNQGEIEFRVEEDYFDSLYIWIYCYSKYIIKFKATSLCSLYPLNDIYELQIQENIRGRYKEKYLKEKYLKEKQEYYYLLQKVKNSFKEAGLIVIEDKFFN